MDLTVKTLNLTFLLICYLSLLFSFPKIFKISNTDVPSATLNLIVDETLYIKTFGWNLDL